MRFGCQNFRPPKCEDTLIWLSNICKTSSVVARYRLRGRKVAEELLAKNAWCLLKVSATMRSMSAPCSFPATPTTRGGGSGNSCSESRAGANNLGAKAFGVHLRRPAPSKAKSGTQVGVYTRTQRRTWQTSWRIHRTGYTPNLADKPAYSPDKD